MTMPSAPIGEDDLNAFLDGQLGEEREREVMAWLEANPSERDRLRDYAEHKLLIRMGAEELAGGSADPETGRLADRLEAALRPRMGFPWRRAAAAAVFLAAGWGAHVLHGQPAEGRLPDYVMEAAGAHLVLAGGASEDVPVAGGRPVDPVSWISSRLGEPVRLPRFETMGLEFVGGKLLPGGTGPLASLVYQDRQGQTVTVYLTPEESQAPDVPRTTEIDGMSVGWWSDGSQSYAVVAEAPEPALQDLLATVREAAPSVAAVAGR